MLKYIYNSNFDAGDHRITAKYSSSRKEHAGYSRAVQQAILFIPINLADT